MNTISTKYVLASGALALLLASAPVAFADSDRGHDKKWNNGNNGLHLGRLVKARFDFNGHKDHKDHTGNTDRTDHRVVSGTVTAKSGTVITLSHDGTLYTVNTANAEFKDVSLADIAVGDTVVTKGDLDGTTLVAKKVRDLTVLRARLQEKFSHFNAGTVTAINGGTITIDPLGEKSTTTVTTNANTLYLDANRATTTAAAITVGSKVFLVGTTTATSSTGDAFVASVVKLIGHGLEHLRFWKWFK